MDISRKIFGRKRYGKRIRHKSTKGSSYLIEFRFFGKSKQEIKKLIYDLNYKFRLGKHRAVPHISLATIVKNCNESRLISDFNELCSNAPFMNFEVRGFDCFDDNRVVYLDIKPSKKLDEFRWLLSKRLQKYCVVKSYECERDFKFHATVAMKLDPNKFVKIKNYTKSIKKQSYKQFVLRATLLKGGIILREYDFLQRKLLNRREAKGRVIYLKTIKLLKEFFEGKYNPDRNIKSWPVEELEEIDIVADNHGDKAIKGKKNMNLSSIVVPKKNIVKLILDYFEPSRIFLIADLHLDHKNIITYCNRPFRNINQMNKVLANNWNRTVRKKDRVYFLGDLSFGRGSRGTDFWLNKLNGKITFIKGSHDNSDKTEMLDNTVLEYEGKKFYLVHDPKEAPSNWNGWVIHGHHHNNHPEIFPFVNKQNKTVNVSAELVNYTPIDLDKILAKTENLSRD